MAEQAPVSTQVPCQSPLLLATAATSGGPANWPSADHCCTQPTVVDNVPSLGAKRTASANNVAGISPPTPENSNTAAYRNEGARATSPLPANVATADNAIVVKPILSSRDGATPRCSSRPDPMLPAMLTAATAAVSTPAADPTTPLWT